MMLRYLISMVMMSTALSACGDQQQATAPQASQQQQTQVQAQPATPVKNATTRVIIPAHPVGTQPVQDSPFANAGKPPTEEARRMADLLNKFGKAGGSLAGAAQPQNAPQ